MKKIFPVLLLLLMLLESCATKKKILLLQDLDAFNNSEVMYSTTKIQPNDILKITVSDLNPVVVVPFSFSGSAQSSSENSQNGYLVNAEGNITFPVLDTIHVSGLSNANLELKIKGRLIKEGYLVNPTVRVRVINNKFTILGEVNSPGVKNFMEESIDLLDAIGMAGDLKISGIRSDVKLIRQLDGKRLVYHIDLTTTSWMLNQEYRIRQNDIIMVTPNKLTINNAGLIKDPIQTLGIIASLLSLYFLIIK